MASQSVGVDVDVEPAVPPTVGTDTTGQIPTDLGLVEGHPVDTPITQSSANGRHGPEAARQVLVGGDSDPAGARRGHGVHHARRQSGMRGRRLYQSHSLMATRYDKLAVRYEATVTVAVINEWL
ncbi:hypothetical protein AB0D30_40085 [Streptomyces sp. NPDC048409]|uniref:hypothetical protein n=1 Tax=Streptomyces sp. NPDC048409 TaxID=3154723 RepID=UPI0034291A53